MTSSIPGYMQGGIDRYVSDGIAPGSFLTAVLSNDLKEAVAQADDININLLPVYVRYFYNEVPSACWGSPAKVNAWFARFEQVAA